MCLFVIVPVDVILQTSILLVKIPLPDCNWILYDLVPTFPKLSVVTAGVVSPFNSAIINLHEIFIPSPP